MFYIISLNGPKGTKLEDRIIGEPIIERKDPTGQYCIIADSWVLHPEHPVRRWRIVQFCPLVIFLNSSRKHHKCISKWRWCSIKACLSSRAHDCIHQVGSTPFISCLVNRFNHLLFEAFSPIVVLPIQRQVILMVTRMLIIPAPVGRMTPRGDDLFWLSGMFILMIDRKVVVPMAVELLEKIVDSDGLSDRLLEGIAEGIADSDGLSDGLGIFWIATYLYLLWLFWTI